MKLFEYITEDYLQECHSKGIKHLTPIFCWFPKKMYDGQWIWLEWAYREILPIKYYVFQHELENPSFINRQPDAYEIRYIRAKQDS